MKDKDRACPSVSSTSAHPPFAFAAALAAGRFVLATRVGGLVQQLGAEKLATLCEPDAASIATALVRFIDAPPPAEPGLDAATAWRDFARRVLDDSHALLPRLAGQGE